jgi:glycosyltransferase involved in cell wall biosynthesis
VVARRVRDGRDLIMRVVLVSNTTPPDKMGGLPRYVRELAAAVARSGCETILLAKRASPEPPAVEDAPDGVRIFRHSVPSKRNPLFAPAYPVYTAYGVLGPLRSARGPDTVVHAHFPATALPLALARTPFIYTFHAPVWRELLDERQGTYALPPPAQRAAVAGMRATERAVVGRARSTFVLSEFMRGHLRELNPDVANVARVMSGGIDIDRFSPDPSSPVTPASSPLLFTARRLTPRMGVDRLLAAMPEILEHHPTATLAIAGTGEMENPLRNIASRLRLDDRVQFLGHVTDQALVEWYRRATLVVMPTLKLEGFGLTTAEALACGTPVVGTPAGATPELLGPLDPKLIASGSTPSDLASTISALLSAPDRLESIAARCRGHVAPTMGWDSIAKRYLEAYEELLENRHR